MNEVLRAENIVKEFGSQRVLNGVSLTIDRGDFVSIVGSSGSGKSTLLTILGGIDKPTSGKVFLGDREISAASEKELALLRRTEIGFVFQFFNLAPYLTAEENVLLPVMLAGRVSAEHRKKADELMKYLGIDACKGKLPSKMSGGEQQRVAIARGLIFDPSVILLDEPTGNLDSRSSLEIMKLLKKINEEMGATIVQKRKPKAARRVRRIRKVPIRERKKRTNTRSVTNEGFFKAHYPQRGRIQRTDGGHRYHDCRRYGYDLYSVFDVRRIL